MTDKYLLYGAPVSLYTGKARAYLRYKKIPYEEILATRSVYKTVIVPRTGVRFIPVIVTPDGRAIQDTSDIIDTLEALYPDPPVYPSTPKQRLTALLLELYGDEWLLLPAMHYRWKYNAKFVIGEFGGIVAPGVPRFLQRIPRTIGDHEFKLAGVAERRAVFPYAQWMLQRPLDYYHSLAGAERHDADEFLTGLGELRPMQLNLTRRVERENNRLVAA